MNNNLPTPIYHQDKDVLLFELNYNNTIEKDKNLSNLLELVTFCKLYYPFEIPEKYMDLYSKQELEYIKRIII